MLEFTRGAIALRKESAALRDGAFVPLDAPEPLLVFERRAGGERFLCLFNLGPAPQRRPLAGETVRLAVGQAKPANAGVGRGWTRAVSGELRHLSRCHRRGGWSPGAKSEPTARQPD